MTVTAPTTTPRCTFDVDRDGNPCGRRLVNGAWCVVHDKVSCSAAVDAGKVIPLVRRCGARLVAGNEQCCPECGNDVRLQTVLKFGV